MLRGKIVMKSALLIVDPQNDFFGDDNPNLPEFQRVAVTINRAIAFFREYSLPIIFLQGTAPHKQAGTHLWEVHRGFDCRPDDIRVTTAYQNAFWNTNFSRRAGAELSGGAA